MFFRRLVARSSSLLVRPALRRFSSLAARPAVTTFSEEEEALRDSIAKFAKEKVAPHVKKMDEEQNMPQEIIDELFEQGFMGVEVEGQYGGAEMNFTSACIVIEELAKVEPGVSVMCDVHNTLVCTALRKYGTERQKMDYLPVITGSCLSSFCLSEAASGSDAFALKTRADKTTDGYVLNGTKMWITNALQAGLYIVFANVDPSKGHKGITAFIVRRNNPGLIVGKKENKLGIRSSCTCELTFNNCKVSEADVLGNVGEGYKIAINLLNEGRIGIAAQMLGLAEGCFDAVMPYLHSRKQFGSRLADFQGMQFQYAQIAAEIEAARVLTYNAARLKDSGRPFVTEAAIAKLTASNVAERCASLCIEWAGGLGFTKDFVLEKYYRDCKVGKIYEGTSNIQLLTIAKSVQAKYSQ